MTFGINTYDASEDLKWNTELYNMPCVEVHVVDLSDYPDAYSWDYPELEGATIWIELSSPAVSVTISYPDDIPTITVGSTGYSYLWKMTVTVFLESIPVSFEEPYTYRVLNADGTFAATPLVQSLIYAESITCTAASNAVDMCGNYIIPLSTTASYYITVAKADYPSPPFVMLDLPSYPYFAGIMAYTDNYGLDTVNWTILFSGVFASTPTAYLFKPRDPSSPAGTGFGFEFYNESDEVIFSSADPVLGFTGPAEVPPIDNFDVPANNSDDVVIGNQDQTWTPDSPLPDNALIWTQAKMIQCTELCYDGKKQALRIIREWNSGMCRYDDTDMMLRLHERTSFSPRWYPGTESFTMDTAGGAYTGSYLIADKDQVIP